MMIGLKRKQGFFGVLDKPRRSRSERMPTQSLADKFQGVQRRIDDRKLKFCGCQVHSRDGIKAKPQFWLVGNRTKLQPFKIGERLWAANLRRRVLF